MTDIFHSPNPQRAAAAAPSGTDRIVGGRGLVPAMSLRWLAGLIALDLALIAVHIVLGATLPTIPHAFNVALDHSLGEQLNYAKWAAVVAALVLAGRARHAPALMALAAAFLLVFLDDSMQIHERLGHALAGGGLLPALGLSATQDMGELAVMAGFAAVLGPVLGLGFVMSDARARRDGLRIVGLLGLLAVFAAGVDQMHGLFRGLPYGIQIADLLEDGGEMIVASIICAHAVAVLRDALDR